MLARAAAGVSSGAPRESALGEESRKTAQNLAPSEPVLLDNLPEEGPYLLGGSCYLLRNYNGTYTCTYSHLRALKGLISGL